MATVNINLSCNLQQAVEVKNLCGSFFSADSGGNTVNVSVYDGIDPASISGTVGANVILPNGNTVTVTGGTVSGNVASIALPADAYAIPGVITVIVKLTSGSVVTTIAAFVISVVRSTL